MMYLLRKALVLPIEVWTGTVDDVATHPSKRWLKLALFSLMLSGVFSLVIVLARTPGLAGLISDPNFARKSLVLHVDLALIVWFYAFLAVLLHTLHPTTKPLATSIGARLSIAGVSLMIATLFIQTADPILANYIPVLDHPLYLIGLILFGGGLAFSFAGSAILPWKSQIEPKLYPHRSTIHCENALLTIRAAGTVLLVAIATFVLSWILTPDQLDRKMFYELVMWGGGHILQFANVLGMITVWLLLIKRITGNEVMPHRLNRILVFTLIVPAILSPVLLTQGTNSQLYYYGFTQLMRWFIFPVVLIYMALGMNSLARHFKKSLVPPGKIVWNMYFMGFLVSIMLTLTGFVLGMMIRSSSTLIPAHYHASLGGVTVAYMVMVVYLMNHHGIFLQSKRANLLSTLQPFLFGIGQTIFVIGFAYAGLHGMGRKMFGADQQIHSIHTMIGLTGMSLGGLMAIGGGILFVYIILRSVNSHKHHSNYGN